MARTKLLRLCDIRNKRHFARHAICAILQNDGIKALTCKTEEDDGESPDRIRRHLADLVSSEDYLQAFRAASHDNTWSALHTIFDQSLAHESVKRTHQY